MLVFPEAWSVIADRARTDVPVLLGGTYSRRDQGADNPTFIVESIKPLAEVRVNGQVAISIQLTEGSTLTTGVLDDVRAVAEAHPGSAPLEVRWSDGNGTQARLKSRSLRLAATNAALTELRALLGTESVRLVRGS